MCRGGGFEGTITVEGLIVAGQCYYGVDSVRVIDRRMEGVAVLAMHWLEDCEKPGWCEGSDENEDGAVDFADFVLVEGCCVEAGIK